ncbi:histidine kinase [Streptomyces sp. AV19]|uniref:sensor histidine kinase n=1 Tax=Streptomyces sp. AV19 TaxID=2793068 RepID=UPI0024138AEC|nr:histidine kinase [Streptomyces sp. AV19]MDG4533926.1 histidine kinase [Streptomyces sp. AV19]
MHGTTVKTPTPPKALPPAKSLPPLSRDPATVFAPAAAVAAGLGVTSLWWALPGLVLAFLAGHRSGRTWPMAAATGALVAMGAAAVTAVPALFPLGGVFVPLVVGVALLPWFAGRLWRQYQELVRAGWSRAEQLEREQRLVAEQARLRERARIAQDMHDALGHDLSLVALSAGALKLAPGLAPEHREAAEDVRVRAAAAVERLGEVIGILREESEQAPDVPADFSLGRLVGGAAASGLDASLRVEGDGHEVPGAVERAAHRVVQEALTNVAKHAPGASVRVSVARSADGTVVSVENTAPAAPASGLPGGGRGLIGLDERVRLAGGSLRHGPHEGGYLVTATLPHTPPRPGARRPAGDGVPGLLPPEQRRARRRAGRTLAAAVAVPLLVLGALTAGLMVWSSLTVAHTVLEPGVYAGLRVGQNRAEVAELLPERQLPYRPRAAEPKGPGVECEYYAVTADRFVDSSGDAYQICFRDGVLSGVAVLRG